LPDDDSEAEAAKMEEVEKKKAAKINL